MEKYSQFRDKGTAIAPFLPVSPPPSSILWLPVSLFFVVARLAFLIPVSLVYFLLLEGIPVGVGWGVQVVKYAALWLMLGIPGVWWVDLQIDGVRRGQLRTMGDHLPRAGSIIASSFTSPLDPLYLAGIFQNPIFTRSFPHTRRVEPISLFRAIVLALTPPSASPPPNSKSRLVSLKHLTQQNPGRIICVFPECTTTNGRGVLPLSPSLLSAAGITGIYAVSLKYTPQDITTPVSGTGFGVWTSWAQWGWRLLHKPTHQMRVRIATKIYNSRSLDFPEMKDGGVGSGSERKEVGSGYDTNIFDQPGFKVNGVHSTDDGWGASKSGVSMRSNGVAGMAGEGDGDVTEDEQKLLDRVGEDLARLGRVKRVGLGVEDKIEFLRVWGKRRR